MKMILGRVAVLDSVAAFKLSRTANKPEAKMIRIFIIGLPFISTGLLNPLIECSKQLQERHMAKGSS
jgi:hypothetical protein